MVDHIGLVRFGPHGNVSSQRLTDHHQQARNTTYYKTFFDQLLSISITHVLLYYFTLCNDIEKNVIFIVGFNLVITIKDKINPASISRTWSYTSTMEIIKYNFNITFISPKRFLLTSVTWMLTSKRPDCGPYPCGYFNRLQETWKYMPATIITLCSKHNNTLGMSYIGVIDHRNKPEDF